MGKDYNKVRDFVFVCNGSDCKSEGAKGLEKAFSKELKRKGIKEEVKIIKTKCTGRCNEAPVVIIKNSWIAGVKEKDVEELVREAFFRKK